MEAISFAELSKQVHLVNDIILSDLITGNEDPTERAESFKKHLLATKCWFVRISNANKKRYVLALLEDIKSAWSLSLLLKSLWNCRPKDAVMSVSERNPWSSYDQMPMDHNRTALPAITLAQVMLNDRMWFLTLEPESQAVMLTELLSIAGGPVLWAVLARAQRLYERYHSKQMQDLLECVVVTNLPPENGQQASPEKTKTPVRKGSETPAPNSSKPGTTTATSGQAQKELEENLLAWNTTIKSLKDNLKLEEIEIKFNDGTKNKVWKVNRPKPEGVETVDFIQLLPSSIGKRILSYLPASQLNEYARVNKYWSFLVDEYHAEVNTRWKLTVDLEKLQEIMLRHDASMNILKIQLPQPSSLCMKSKAPSVRPRVPLPSTRVSEKSGGAFSKSYLNEKLKQTCVVQQKPIRNMAELSERLARRGAADENIWKWCENLLKHAKKTNKQTVIENINEGVLPSSDMYFPCPMMRQTLKLPLNPPLVIDPAVIPEMKPKRKISSATVMQIPKVNPVKHYSLWSKDLSSLYPVLKIPFYQLPT